MLSGEATNTNFIVFGSTRSWLEPTIYHTRDEHANPHKLNICITSKAESLTSQTLNEQIFPHKVETLHYGSRLQYPQKHKRSKILEQNEFLQETLVNSLTFIVVLIYRGWYILPDVFRSLYSMTCALKLTTFGCKLGWFQTSMQFGWLCYCLIKSALVNSIYYDLFFKWLTTLSYCTSCSQVPVFPVHVVVSTSRYISQPNTNVLNF